MAENENPEAQIPAEQVKAEPGTGNSIDQRASESTITREVSALTIARMMGLATVSDLKVTEGKLDLLSTRVSTLVTRFERLMQMASSFPSGSDLERIDVQIGSLKAAIREAVGVRSAAESASDANSDTAKKIRAKILANSATPAAVSEEKPTS